jgi:hypothetical protein
MIRTRHCVALREADEPTNSSVLLKTSNLKLKLTPCRRAEPTNCKRAEPIELMELVFCLKLNHVKLNTPRQR